MNAAEWGAGLRAQGPATGLATASPSGPHRAVQWHLS